MHTYVLYYTWSGTVALCESICEFNTVTQYVCFPLSVRFLSLNVYNYRLLVNYSLLT